MEGGREASGLLAERRPSRPVDREGKQGVVKVGHTFRVCLPQGFRTS